MTALTEPTQELPEVAEVADTFPGPPQAPESERRKPGPAKGAPQRGGRRGTAAAAPPRRSTPNKPTAQATTKVDYSRGIQELASVPIGALAGYGMLLPANKGEAYLADAAVLSQLAPVVGDAAAKFAESNPNHRLVGYMDKALTVGPYAMFGAALATAIVQIAANHRIVPPGLMGSRHPKILAYQMRASMAAHAEAQTMTQPNDQALLDLINEAEQEAAQAA